MHPQPHTPTPPHSHNPTPPQSHPLFQVVPTALRGAFQSCGQNCAGAERFIVQEGVYDDFVARVTAVAKQLRQGPALGDGMVDCGAMCMPGLAEKVHGLVQDAVAHGAKVRGVAGGRGVEVEIMGLAWK